jgi:hypothetical protein
MGQVGPDYKGATLKGFTERNVQRATAA